MKTQALSLCPFVPSGSDFKEAVRFFEAIGFAREWGDDNMCGLRFGGASIILQNANIPVWQENQMVCLYVDDLEGYWKELVQLDLPEKFKGVKVKEPTDFPWGREINIIDPAGVCWHISKRK